MPVDPTLPAETFEVLIVQRQTLGVLGLSPQRLGDSPVITVGPAIGGSGTRFEWTSVRFNPTGVRTTLARFAFDRLDTQETAGTLRLEASWSCPLFATCDTPPDARACALERAFTASPIVPSTAWTTVTTPPLAGAKPYLVVIDTGALARSEGDCMTPGMPATRELTPAARAIEVWQIAWPLVRAPVRIYAVRGAPAVEAPSDFGPIVEPRVSVSDAGVDAKETRTTSAVLNVPCSNVGGRGIDLSSDYQCEGTGCASLPPPEDHGSCSVSVPFFTFEL